MTLCEATARRDFGRSIDPQATCTLGARGGRYQRLCRVIARAVPLRLARPFYGYNYGTIPICQSAAFANNWKMQHKRPPPPPPRPPPPPPPPPPPQSIPVDSDTKRQQPKRQASSISNGSNCQWQGSIPREQSGTRRRGVSSSASASATSDRFADNDNATIDNSTRPSDQQHSRLRKNRRADAAPSIIQRIKQFLYSLTVPLPEYDGKRHVSSTSTIAQIENDELEVTMGGSPSKAYGTNRSGQIPVPLAVLAWYLLGVLSITTTKILLTDPKSSISSLDDDYHALREVQNPMAYIGGLNPLVLTVQQFSVGVLMLGSIQYFRPTSTAESSSISKSRQLLKNDRDLFRAGIYFSFGFLITNMSFRRGDAAFVETVKAAEPLTSAGTAVLFGIESLGLGEVVSLGGIVAGVVLSTLGHASRNSAGTMATQSISEVALTSLVVLMSNLCFSFRGLHQKLFRAKPRCGKDFVDDVMLQFRMQLTGLLAFGIPALIIYSMGVLKQIAEVSRRVGLLQSGILWQYLGISLVNGVAFTSYNLASTYVLSRISVVHHAALNCIRRLFAIVVTSIAFGVPITLLSVLGILVSIGGFACFTYFKHHKARLAKRSASYLPLNSTHES